MKKIFSFLMVISMAASYATADLLVSDNFSYVGALTANGWSAYSGADASVTANGSVAAIGSGAEDIRLAFADQTTGPTYASLTLRVISLPTTGSEYSFGFTDSTTMESRFGIASESSGANFGLNIWGGSSTVSNTFSGLSLSTDYRVTIYFDGVNNHRLWVNSDGTDFASPDLQALGVNNGIDSFFIRQAGALDVGAASWTIDDLVVGNTFADVVPEPTTISLLGAGLLGLSFLRRKIFA